MTKEQAQIKELNDELVEKRERIMELEAQVRKIKERVGKALRAEKIQKGVTMSYKIEKLSEMLPHIDFEDILEDDEDMIDIIKDI